MTSSGASAQLQSTSSSRQPLSAVDQLTGGGVMHHHRFRLLQRVLQRVRLLACPLERCTPRSQCAILEVLPAGRTDLTPASLCNRGAQRCSHRTTADHYSCRQKIALADIDVLDHIHRISWTTFIAFHGQPQRHGETPTVNRMACGMGHSRWKRCSSGTVCTLPLGPTMVRQWCCSRHSMLSAEP